jgi:hypothetical protein
MSLPSLARDCHHKEHCEDKSQNLGLSVASMKSRLTGQPVFRQQVLVPLEFADRRGVKVQREKSGSFQEPRVTEEE